MSGCGQPEAECALAEPIISSTKCRVVGNCNLQGQPALFYATTPLPPIHLHPLIYLFSHLPTTLPSFFLHHLFTDFPQISSHSFLDSRSLSLIPLFSTQSLFQQSYQTFPREPASGQLHQVRVERDFIAISSSLFTALCSLCGKLLTFLSH